MAAVILASGFSRRLGRPKQTLALGGETLVERTVRVAQEAGLSPVIVVVADGTHAGASEQMGAIVLVNAEAAEGMGASIRCGVKRAKQLGVAGAVLMACDQVALSPEHLRRLLEDENRIAGSRYAGRTGVPAYFPKTSFDHLLQLRGDAGARELLRDAYAVTAEELSLDIDTEADVERARAVVEG